MNHTIILTFQGEKVHVDPNPLPASGQVVAGDTVTWLIEPQAARGRELQVLFERVRDLPNGLPPGVPCNPLGLFSSLSLGTGLIVGTVGSNPFGGNPKSPRRFLYGLYEKGKRLTLVNSVSGEAANSGSIDIPMTPGGSE